MRAASHRHASVLRAWARHASSEPSNAEDIHEAQAATPGVRCRHESPVTVVGAGDAVAALLVSRAVLPAGTFAVGPTSGQFIPPPTIVCLRSYAVNRCRDFRRCSARATATSW